MSVVESVVELLLLVHKASRNGVWSIERLYVVLYPHSTAGIFSSQSSLSVLDIFVNPFVNVLLNASIAPFD